MKITFKREWHNSERLRRAIGRTWYDEWGWVGLAINRLTIRLWWIGNGSTFFAGASASSMPWEEREPLKMSFYVRLWRMEFDVAWYRTSPISARPDLWA